MNIGTAIPSTPTPNEGEPPRADSEAGKAFAALFGVAIGASGPTQKPAPQIAEIPPIDPDAPLETPNALPPAPEAEPPAPVALETPQPQATTMPTAPAAPVPAIVIAPAGSSGVKVQRFNLVVPPVLQPAEVEPEGEAPIDTTALPALKVLAPPVSMPAQIEPVIPDTVVAEPALTVTGAAAPRAAPSETALAALAAAPAADNAQTATGAPVLANAPQVPAPDAAAPPPVRPEVVLQTRPERMAADVAIEIVRQVGADRSQFTIRLDPPDLGRIDVELNFDNGKVRAVVTTDNPSTHDLLRRDAEGLARMLADNGFRADGGSFRFDLRQDGGQQRGFAGAEPRSSKDPAAEAAEPLVETTRSTRRGLLDLVA